MVKVKQSFNFSHQEIYPLPSGSISALTFIGKSYLAISQRTQHCIDIYDLNNKYEDPDSQQKKLKKLTIPTIGEVMDMVYCNSGNYLLLLERNTPSSKSVRVLTNFSSFKKEESLSSFTIAPRIASKTTPISLYNVFDVIEIPTSNTPRLIACCQSTAALTISCDNRLYFYSYRRCLHDIHRFTYIDFVPFKFSIYLSFHPTTVLISENVICAMNNVYALAFKIVFKKGENSQDTSIASNSFETDSLDGTSGAAFYDNENKVVPEKSNIFECIDFKTFLKDEKNHLKLKSDKESGPCKDNDENISSIEKPVKINSIKVRIIGDLDDETNCASRFDIKYLIQLCIRSSKGSYSNFTCMDIKPVYILPQSTCSTVESFYNPFLSDNYPFCIGYSFLLASNSEGYLYQFGSQESWINDNGKYLATYQFTAPVLKVKIDDFVIQAITTESIETYTSRTAHKIFSNRFEYTQMHGIYPEECSPDLNSPPTLIGLCSFLNIHTACLHDDKLILITDNKTLLPQQQQQQSTLKFPVKFRLNSTTTPPVESSLTMYCLKFPHVLHFIDDLETIAQNFLDYNSSTENFFDLMEEANCILRLTQVLNINYITNDTRELLKNKLDKNCRRLAEFTLCSNVMKLEVQAFGYFKMCGVTVDGIYSYFTQNIYTEEKKDKVHNGFLYTIKKFLGEPDIKSESLQQLITSPIFTDSSESTTLAIEFFNMFKKFIPEELAPIALKSTLFLHNVNNEITEYLIAKQEKTLLENFLLSLTYFRRRPNAVQMSQDILEKLSRFDIYSTLITFPNIIFEAPDTFTDFMEDVLLTLEDKQEIVDGLSDVFITMLSINRSVTIEALLSIFMDYFSTHIGHRGYKSSQVILSNVLQTHLYNLFSRSFETNVKKETTEISEKSTTNEWEGHEQQFHVLNESNSNTFEFDPDFETDSSNFTSLNVDRNDPKAGSTYPKESQQASKVLFRIYLGQLKQFSQNTDSENFKSKSYLELYRFVISNADLIKSQQKDFLSVTENKRVLPLLPSKDDLDNFRRPIPGIDDRPVYLNKMFPFDHDKHFAKNRRDEGGVVTYDFIGWEDPLVVLLLKIQSLLSSPQTDPLILEDFVEFIHNNTNLLGIESLLTLIVPRQVALNYLIEHYPKLVIPFAVSMKLQPAQWEMFFKNLLNKKDKIPHWEFHLDEILKHLVNEKSYEELILCFPKKYYNVENNPPENCSSEGRVVMDGIDESNAFQVIIRAAVAKKRSSAIKEMIETTGHQLLQHQL